MKFSELLMKTNTTVIVNSSLYLSDKSVLNDGLIR